MVLCELSKGLFSHKYINSKREVPFREIPGCFQIQDNWECSEVSCSQDSLSFSTFELDSQELIERWFQMQCGSNSHSLGLVMSENGLYHTQYLKPLHARHALPNVVQQSLGRLWVILIPLIHYVTI